MSDNPPKTQTDVEHSEHNADRQPEITIEELPQVQDWPTAAGEYAEGGSGT